MPRRAAPSAPASAKPTIHPTKRPGLRPAAITPAMIAQQRALAEPRWSASGAHIYYLESHDAQGALFAVPVAGGPARRLTSDPPSAAVASYSGGFYAVSREAVVYQSGGALYRIPTDGGRGRKLPTGGGSIAAPVFSPDGRQIAYVSDDGTTSDIGIVAASGEEWPRKVAVHASFVADPVWSPNGRMLAWVEWSVPNMGWDESRLVLYDTRTEERRVVMGEPETAVTQPRWSPDGKTLAFCCDRGGYMNLWQAHGDGSDPRPWVTERYDHAPPLWGSGGASYAWSADGRHLAYTRDTGVTHELRLLDVASGESSALGASDGVYVGLRWAPRGDRLLALYSSPTHPSAVVLLDTKRDTQQVVATTALGGLDIPETLVAPEAITWKSTDGLEAHGLLYRPRGLAGNERPPLLVQVHGGPTGHTSAMWAPITQYWVQRGWAVFAPNARGSSGHGRKYIQALRDEWGGADMADIDAGIAHIIGRGWADGERVVVWGGSAGGYAVLILPVLYPDRFKAGVSLFGVSDLFGLSRTTHRLEAHYLDRIVGPLPETAARYHDRSPVFRAAEYGCPLLMLQGDKDVAVTPDQAQAMASALQAAGKTFTLHWYEGEGHGWSRAATVADYIARMDRFLEEYALLR